MKYNDVLNFVMGKAGSGRGGGGSSAVELKDVNFYDYDGTCVASYTATEFASLTELPPNPSHEGLVAQGWNWTLADAKAYVASYGVLDIGQAYITDDNKTRLYVRLEDGALSPAVGFGVNGTAKINWGDGSSPTTVTGTSLSIVRYSQHTYAKAGSYIIAIEGQIGILSAVGGNTSLLCAAVNGTPSPLDNLSFRYRDSLFKVELGDAFISNYGFYSCRSLQSITIPVVTNSAYASIPDAAFQGDASLHFISIPTGYTQIRSSAFDSVPLRAIALPNTLTTIKSLAFSKCYPLRHIALPASLRTLEATVFSYCNSLVSVIFPALVQSLGNNVFSNCRALGKLSFGRSTPPTLGSSSVFSTLPTDCKIHVPIGHLSDYQTAANYPDPSTYTYVDDIAV